MKKVVCLIENLSPGGAERQMVYLATILKEIGNNVQVWTYYPGDFYLPLLDGTGVEFKYIAKAQSKTKRIFVLKKEFGKFKPDIVFAYLDTACVVASIIKALGGNFKLIVSERNTTQGLNIRERIKFFCYRYADYIVPNSETQGNFIKKIYPELENKVKVITNYVDVNGFHPALHSYEDESLKVVVVGRVMPQKNPITLMRAIKILVDKGVKICVDWYGNTYNGEYSKHCEAEINELGINSIFKFLPATTQISEIYKKYDVFCLPSVFEGFSNVICEAMCCGLPILCSDVADNPLIVEKGENAFLFNPNEVDSIVNAFEKFIELPSNEKKEYANSSRKIALKKFSKEKFINSYQEIL